MSSVALAAGADPAATALALDRLLGFGLVDNAEECVPSRPVRREVVWKLSPAAWGVVPDVLRHTAVPQLLPGPLPDRLPERFAHLFWWGDPSQYRLPRDASFVAEQILTCDDASAWGWALWVLPVEALTDVAARPHVPQDRRDLAAAAAASRCDEP